MHYRVHTLALLMCLSPLAKAQQGPPLKPVTAAERRAVVATLADQLQAKYVFPDAAKELAAALVAREAAGAYAGANDTAAFAEALATDMRTLGKDGHFNVRHAPGFKPRAAAQAPTADELDSSGGGSNPGEMYVLASGFAAFIPDGRAINPVTKTNWEHVGVKSDIAVPAADARKVAHAAILRGLIRDTENVEEKMDLEEALTKVEAGVVDAPVYVPRR